jgi:hypothetical protein
VQLPIQTSAREEHTKCVRITPTLEASFVFMHEIAFNVLASAMLKQSGDPESVAFQLKEHANLSFISNGMRRGA